MVIYIILQSDERIKNIKRTAKISIILYLVTRATTNKWNYYTAWADISITIFYSAVVTCDNIIIFVLSVRYYNVIIIIRKNDIRTTAF